MLLQSQVRCTLSLILTPPSAEGGATTVAPVEGGLSADRTVAAVAVREEGHEATHPPVCLKEVDGRTGYE